MKADEKKSVHRYNTIVSFLSRPRLCASRPNHAKVKLFFCASCAVDIFPLLLSFSVCFQGAFQKYVHPSFSIVPRHCAPGALWLSFLWGCTETTTADLWPFFCIQCWMCILYTRAVLKQCGEQILQKTVIMCVRACAWVPKNLIEKMYIYMSSTRTWQKIQKSVKSIRRKGTKKEKQRAPWWGHVTSILSERIRIKNDPASKFKNKTDIGRSLSPTKRGV